MEADGDTLEGRIAEWRAYLRRHGTAQTPVLEELEGRLRDEAAALQEAGLDGGEAFLIAVRRVGVLDAATREFGRAHAGRLWEQAEGGSDADDAAGRPFLERALAVLVPGDGKAERTEAVVVLGLAVAAALLVKAPELFGVNIGGRNDDAAFYARNLSLFVLPLLAGYFVWKRGFDACARLVGCTGIRWRRGVRQRLPVRAG